ncbi:MAG: HAD family hydrolase [Candidatus Aenigmarchaeota archaeon]|nr:HAD family hydrolase [Candidatus Aenigmarchaeota archaeon]
MAKTVVFDFGGVLCVEPSRRPRDLRTAKEMLNEIGLHYSDEQLQETVNNGMKKYKEFSYQTQRELEERQIIRDYIFSGLHETEKQKITAMADELFYEIDSGSHTLKIGDDVKETLLELKERGYRLGLISNTVSPNVKDFLKREGFDGIFEFQIYSHEEGVKKPSKQLFEKAQKFLGLKPEECAYVGDTFDKDVAGAHGAGWGAAILMDYSGKHTDKGEADYKIKDFKELLEIFPE